MGELADYESRRDFSKCPEPPGGGKGKRRPGALRFVIEEHEASCFTIGRRRRPSAREEVASFILHDVAEASDRFG